MTDKKSMLQLFSINFNYSGWSDDLSTGYILPLNAWTQIVGLYDGSAAIIYVNRVLRASSSKPSWNTLLTGNLTLRQKNKEGTT